MGPPPTSPAKSVASPQVVVINTATGTTTTTINLSGPGTSAARNPTRSVRACTRRRLPGSSGHRGNDRPTTTTTTTTPVGAGVAVGLFPTGLAVLPSGASLTSPHTASDTVTVIDTATQTVTDTIPVSGGPTTVAITPTARSLCRQRRRRNAVDDQHPSNVALGTTTISPLQRWVTVNATGTKLYVSYAGSDGKVAVSLAALTPAGNGGAGGDGGNAGRYGRRRGAAPRRSLRRRQRRHRQRHSRNTGSPGPPPLRLRRKQGKWAVSKRNRRSRR